MTPCKRCQGTGTYIYPDSSTWTRGIGGQTMTADTCDRCWGTGDTDNPGENLRVKLARERRR
jgi:hypothetical protein